MTERPASRVLVLALNAQKEAHDRATAALLAAALADDPSIKGATLDLERGVWILPAEA